MLTSLPPGLVVDSAWSKHRAFPLIDPRLCPTRLARADGPTCLSALIDPLGWGPSPLGYRHRIRATDRYADFLCGWVDGARAVGSGTSCAPGRRSHCTSLRSASYGTFLAPHALDRRNADPPQAQALRRSGARRRMAPARIQHRQVGRHRRLAGATRAVGLFHAHRERRARRDRDDGSGRRDARFRTCGQCVRGPDDLAAQAPLQPARALRKHQGQAALPPFYRPARPWLGQAPRARIDLGRGIRQIVAGGRLDQHYQITVPRDFAGKTTAPEP